MRSAAALLSIILLAPVSGCDASTDSRESEITSALVRVDEPQIRQRPQLVAGKYTRMALSPFDFYRGSLPIFRHDMHSGTSPVPRSRFALDVPLVPSIGDPHPENFGVLRASDGSMAIEPNDFDSADRAPFLWDVRRLTAGMALAAMLANEDSPDARARTAAERFAVARSAAEGYREAIDLVIAGRPPGRHTPDANTSAILTEAFTRSERDQARRRELLDFTVLDPNTNTRRLKRGVLDPTDTQNVYAELDARVAKSLPDAIARYRDSLVVKPPADDLRVLDAVREHGSGVASWPRVRVIVLVRGPSEDPADDRLLEVKELGDSLIAGLYPPGLYADSVTERITGTSRRAWARPDGEAFWGVTSWLGLPCQVRLESEGQKNVRLSRMVGALGTAAALRDLGFALGKIVGRVHTSGADGAENARAIRGAIDRDREGFLDEQANAAVAYAETVLSDHQAFVHALRTRGLRLGVPFDAIDLPRDDFAAALGTPPPPPPLPATP